MEGGPLRAAVQGERAVLAGGVGAGEDPVLPGRQPAEDLGLVGKAPRKRGRKAGTTTAGTSHAKAGVKRRGRHAKATGIRTAIKKQPASGDRRSVVAPKYRDSASGATWTGRGKQPKWLAAALKGGQKLEDFKI